MRKCRHLRDADCSNPMLKCTACPVYLDATETARSSLVPARVMPGLPDPRPYVKIGTPSGRPAFGIEVGISGTF